MFFYPVTLSFMLSSFSGKCAKFMLPNESTEELSSLVIPTKAYPPKVLVAQIGDDIFKFEHYDYTMTRCIWPKTMTLTQKAIVFTAISEKVNKFNYTLKEIIYE